MKHYVTNYTENGKLYAESWIQVNVFGKNFCFSKRKIEIPDKMSKLVNRLEDFDAWCRDERKNGVHFVLDCVIPNLDD